MQEEFINPWFAAVVIAVLWAFLIFLMLRLNHKLKLISMKLPKAPTGKVTKALCVPLEPAAQLREALEASYFASDHVTVLFDYDKEIAKGSK